MKKFYFLSLLSVLLVNFAGAQTFSLDSTAYRPSVIIKTQDVFAAINNSQSEQVALAVFFRTEEDSLAVAVNNNVPQGQIDQMEVQFITQFQSLLSPDELILYRQQRPVSMYARDLSVPIEQ